MTRTIVCLLLLVSTTALGQFPLDSTRATTNNWQPTNAQMEMAYHIQWANNLKRDTLLLRLGQYFVMKYDTISRLVYVDSVIGAGNNRVTYMTGQRVTPRSIKAYVFQMAYNEPFKTTDYLPHYPKSYTRNWVRDPLAVSYQFQYSDSANFTRIQMDTTLTDTTIVASGFAHAGVFYFRVRSIYASGTSAWINLPNITMNNSILIAFDRAGTHVAVMRPIKMVNDGPRTQVMVEISWFTNPKFIYN